MKPLGPYLEPPFGLFVGASQGYPLGTFGESLTSAQELLRESIREEQGHQEAAEAGAMPYYQRVKVLCPSPHRADSDRLGGKTASSKAFGVLVSIMQSKPYTSGAEVIPHY